MLTLLMLHSPKNKTHNTPKTHNQGLKFCLVGSATSPNILLASHTYHVLSYGQTGHGQAGPTARPECFQRSLAHTFNSLLYGQTGLIINTFCDNSALQINTTMHNILSLKHSFVIISYCSFPMCERAVEGRETLEHLKFFFQSQSSDTKSLINSLDSIYGGSSWPFSCICCK